MIPMKFKDQYTLSDLTTLMAQLRSPEGCMWDRVQDHRSIRRNFLEETDEAVEAIDNNNIDLLCEELGDVLLQIIFHTQIEAEQGNFTIEDVITGVCKKLITRHPHIFKDEAQPDVAPEVTNWDDLKKIEKNQTTTTESLVGVARTLPALIRADKVQRKAAKAGFEFPDVQGAMDKLQEEVGELSLALEGEGDVIAELGDVMFAAVKVARFVDADPEEALECTTDRFISRFNGMEKHILGQGQQLTDLTLDEMTEHWQYAKEH